MASLKSSGPFALFISLAAVAACTGELGGRVSNGEGGPTRPESGNDSDDIWGNGDAPVEKPLTLSSVTMRRLNSAEYNNTVRDLLQTDLRPGDDFPTDDLGGGFPTVGSALSLSPAYVIKYEAAAYALIDDLFSSEARKTQHVPCDISFEGEICARQVLDVFARKAWRRPVTDEELSTLLHPLNVAQAEGATPIIGLKHALIAVLLSPHFLFKVETSTGKLNGYELATRLSYSLWGTMPDELLLQAAASGELLRDDGLASQVVRMLSDARAQALLDHFAARWLDYLDLEKHEVNRDLFSDFTPELAESMKQEANRFIYDALQSDRPASDMLTSQYTFINETLGAHYGISAPRPSDVPSGELWKVDASSAQRGGLLTLGALLTHTSLTSRTSPVKRGDFVFKHMLCGQIPPPPPQVEGLPDSEAVEGETLRQRMERHSQDPECTGCHKVMDPIGFGLEHFDGIGRYRTHDGAGEVDASGVLPDNTAFYGAQELAQILSENERFSFCVTRHFMTYAVGRIQSSRLDEEWTQYLTQQANAAGGSLESIITAVILSEPFRHRMIE